MLVALVLAVLAALVVTTLLLAQRRTLAATRSEAAAAVARAATAEAAAADATRAVAAAEARAQALHAAERAAASTVADRAAALADCERRAAEAEADLTRCTDAHAEAQQALSATTASLERSSAAARAAEARVGVLEDSLRTTGELAAARATALERAEAQRAALQGELDGRATGGPAQTGGPPLDAALERCWRLLLTRIERQWANAVGAGPEERGVAAGDSARQLAQALARELERLREEVGLHTDATVTGTMAGVHPLLVLLAAGELSAIAAPHSERVVVELGAALMVVGEGWSGGPAEQDRLLSTLEDAGLPGRVEAADGDVRVVAGVGPGGPLTPRS